MKYIINIRNLSNSNKTFYVFQQPAIYQGGAKVFTNSLWNGKIRPYNEGASIATFSMFQEFYAGVQEASEEPIVGHEVSEYSTAVRKIDLNIQSNTDKLNMKNMTTMVINPLGLEEPVNCTDSQLGSFRVKTPVYDSDLTSYYVGLASKTQSGRPILSSFIDAVPNSFIDCQPVLKFYVQVGDYKASSVINFTTSSQDAAVCDATSGQTEFSVDYTSTGEFVITYSS
ncbi:MAG: hypothetical protein K2X69_02915 [Silvanigrellaceae bacterium]|nr:hypothetical protein [Silvanigrellaceae bacterium]